MLDPNRNRNQLPPPVTTGTGQYTAGTPIAPRTAQGSVPVGPQRVDFSSTPALQKLLQPAPASKGYTQSNVNASRSGAGLVAPPLTPTQPPPSQGGGQGGGRPGRGLVPAAQAATPSVAPPLAKPASFTDPAGNTRYFADPKSAATAQGALQSPQGLADLRNQIQQRPFDLTQTGQIPPGTFTSEELAFAAPGPAQQVSLAAPATGGTDVVRGTQVSAGGGAGTGGGDGSPVEQLRNDIASRIQYGIDGGSPIAGYAPELAFLKGIPETAAEKGSTPLTLSQFQAQRAQELTQNPGGINPADQLVFGNGWASAAPNLYSKPEYNEYGEKISEVPYLYDAEGNARPLNFAAPAATGAPEGGQASAPSPQAIAIQKAFRAGKITREQARAQLTALRSQPQ